MGMALAQLIGADALTNMGQAQRQRTVWSENQELCLVMLHLFRLIASKRRQSNGCNIEGRLDYSGQKPARQRAKKTAKPFQHRGLE